MKLRILFLLALLFSSASTHAQIIGTFTDAPDLKKMTQALGFKPGAALVYVDSAQPLSNFAASGQYEADNFFAQHGPDVIPLLGLPMAGAGQNAKEAFRMFASGQLDGTINKILQSFADKGYQNIVLRPGFEMNGGWFSWTVTDDNAGDFIAAFRQITKVAHNFKDAIVSINFNPNVGKSIDINKYYPGNAYVDSIGIDIYGQPWTSDTSPTDTNGSPTNLTFCFLIDFAKANNKPFSIPETGAATDNTAFPQQLIVATQSMKAQIAFVGLWNSNAVNDATWTNSPAATAVWVAFAEVVVKSSPSNGNKLTEYQLSSAKTAVDGTAGEILKIKKAAGAAQQNLNNTNIIMRDTKDLIATIDQQNASVQAADTSDQTAALQKADSDLASVLAALKSNGWVIVQ